MISSVHRAVLLGPYPGNTHTSINYYFDCCRNSIQSYLQGWDFVALQPGRFDNNDFLKADVGRAQAWKELYFDWPLRLRKLDADVFHIVDQGMAWYRLFVGSTRRSSKTIVTVHDVINVLTMRGRMPFKTLPLRREQLVRLCVSQIRKSEAVICPSQSTATDVAQELGIAAGRLHVIHNFIPAVFRPMAEGERLAARKRIYGDVTHAILHVGKPTEYKNRVGALKAFEMIHAALPDSKLVLTSQALAAEEQAFLRGRSCAEAVEVRQPAEQEGLRELYSTADVFLFPSITEGFGWPPLEAMACGCPVVSSTGGSLAEVVGDGGVRMDDPLNAGAFANAAIELLKDPQAAAQWRTKGLKNASRFSEATLGPQLADLYSTLAR